MEGPWRCSTCRKFVVPKNGKLSCCGITETVEAAEAARRNWRKEIVQKFNTIFDPVITHYGDHPDDDVHEGIPNND